MPDLTEQQGSPAYDVITYLLLLVLLTDVLREFACASLRSPTATQRAAKTSLPMSPSPTNRDHGLWQWLDV